MLTHPARLLPPPRPPPPSPFHQQLHMPLLRTLPPSAALHQHHRHPLSSSSSSAAAIPFPSPFPHSHPSSGKRRSSDSHVYLHWRFSNPNFEPQLPHLRLRPGLRSRLQENSGLAPEHHHKTQLSNSYLYCLARDAFNGVHCISRNLDSARVDAKFALAYRILRKVSLPLAVFLLDIFFSLQLPALATSGPQGASNLAGPGILTSGWAGLMAGGLHALTGPDHLAALAPLCLGRSKLESALVGALWGCGHDAGQVIFGLIFLLLKGRLHIELVRTWASRVVGVTLLAIGAVGLKEAQEVPVSVLAGECASTAETAESLESKNTTRRLRTFATGLVYGLQPDALIMILPALAFPSRLAGAAYLGMFLLGTIVAMGSYTAFIGSCGQALQKRVPWITRRLTIGSSIIAIAFGIGVLVGEIFGISLF